MGRDRRWRIETPPIAQLQTPGKLGILTISEKGLSEEFVIKLFRSIHQESINHQTSVMNKE